jgi:uncharacterized protein YjiS (DUF1127 family)
MYTQDVDIASNPQSNPILTAARVKAKFTQWTERYPLAYEVAEERRTLAKLDQSMLSDIGITADQARAESRRGFWDLKKIKGPVQR